MVRSPAPRLPPRCPGPSGMRDFVRNKTVAPHTPGVGGGVETAVRLSWAGRRRGGGGRARAVRGDRVHAATGGDVTFMPPCLFLYGESLIEYTRGYMKVTAPDPRLGTWPS
jgi:hypothetical protein